MLRTETVLGGFFLATWVVAILYVAGAIELPRPLLIDLYGLFIFSAAFGWVVGNVYVLRRRALEPGRIRRRFFGLYLAVPAGTVALARAMTPDELRAAAPLGGLLALAVYTVFFFVPVVFGRRG